MRPMAYGYQVVEHNMARDGSDYSVVAQREEMDQIELWHFGIFDALIGDKVTNYMQSYFFYALIGVTKPLTDGKVKLTSTAEKKQKNAAPNGHERRR
ncbi:hypothetical protein JHK85_006704 [Glycine max]|nr:hypothetical protein JHK85_006704 [Glycine max]